MTQLWVEFQQPFREAPKERQVIGLINWHCYPHLTDGETDLERLNGFLHWHSWDFNPGVLTLGLPDVAD